MCEIRQHAHRDQQCMCVNRVLGSACVIACLSAAVSFWNPARPINQNSRMQSYDLCRLRREIRLRLWADIRAARAARGQP